MFFQIVIVSCLGFFAHAQIDVSQCTAYKNASDACNTANKLEGGDDLTWKTVLEFYKLDGMIHCNDTNKDHFMKGAVCIHSAYIDCAKNDFQNFVPSIDGLKTSLEYFCNNYEDFDVKCVEGFDECVNNKSPMTPQMSEGYEKNKKYYCGKVDHTAECIKSNDKLKNCDKDKSKEVFMKITSEIVPPACSATSIVFSSVLLLVSLFVSL